MLLGRGLYWMFFLVSFVLYVGLWLSVYGGGRLVCRAAKLIKGIGADWWQEMLLRELGFDQG